LTGNQQYEEKLLLLRISQGDEKAFAHLMKIYHVGVYSAVVRLTGDRWMAEEVVQDLFLRVWLKRSQLPEVENFHAWLKTIAQHLTLNAIKSSLRKKNSVKDWFAGFYDDMEVVSPTNDPSYLADLLKQAIDKLSPRQNEVIMLVKQQGYQREEVARMLNISSETVKTHLEQAMRNVRAYCLSHLDKSALFIIALLGSKNFF
jgi:RNA polymerase sigma factor (sigma-70 family)